MNDLHIGLYTCLEVSKCLKEADRKRIQAEFDYARHAERERQRATMEALRLEQEAVKAAKAAEKVEIQRQVEVAEEASGYFGNFTIAQIAEVHRRYFDLGETEIEITKVMFGNANASSASTIVTRIVAFERSRRWHEAIAAGAPIPTIPKPAPKAKGKPPLPPTTSRKKRGSPLPPSAEPLPPSAEPKPPSATPVPVPPVIPTPATPSSPSEPLEFPKTLTAARALERDQWALGDALIEECGPPGKHGIKDGSRARIAKAAEYLHSNGCGFGYSEESLRVFRDISHLYPEGIRVPSVSWTAHRFVPGPEWMARILADLPAGETLTVIKAKEMVAAIEAAQGDNVVPLRQPEAAIS